MEFTLQCLKDNISHWLEKIKRTMQHIQQYLTPKHNALYPTNEKKKKNILVASLILKILSTKTPKI